MKKEDKIKSPFLCYCQKVIPLAFDESLSYYEQLCHLVYKMKEIVDAQNEETEAISELQEKYQELVEYVDHYFDNLDVQQEIDNKLDEMAESGQLAELVAQYLDLGALLSYDTLADMKAGTNFTNGSNCRIMGLDSYNDGRGKYYHIRGVLNTDDIDNYHVVALTNYPELVAELVEENVSQPSTVGEPVAHRGCPLDAIENTIESFNYAYQKGFKYYECDLQLTSDKYMVLFHNAQVDATTDGTGTVNELTYSYLRSLTYTSGGNLSAYPDHGINDIDEMLDFLKNHEIKCFLEIKETWDNESLINLYNKIKTAGLMEQVIYIAYNTDYAEKMRQLDRKIQVGVITASLTDDDIDYFYEYNFMACVNLPGLTVENVEKAHQKGISVYGWTIEARVQYDIVCNKKVDFICTNSRLYCVRSLTVPLGTFNYVYPYFSRFDKYLLEHGYTIVNCSAFGYPNMQSNSARAISVVKVPVKAGDVLNFSFDSTKYSLSFPTMSANGTTAVDSGWLTGTSYTITGANSKWGYCYFKKNDGTDFLDYELDEVGTIAQNINITRA